MSLFKKRKKIEVEEKTELEKAFEEKGQQIGRETGGMVPYSNSRTQTRGSGEEGSIHRHNRLDPEQEA